jgi:hypothetical protein
MSARAQLAAPGASPRGRGSVHVEAQSPGDGHQPARQLAGDELHHSPRRRPAPSPSAALAHSPASDAILAAWTRNVHEASRVTALRTAATAASVGRDRRSDAVRFTSSRIGAGRRPAGRVVRCPLSRPADRAGGHRSHHPQPGHERCWLGPIARPAPPGGATQPGDGVERRSCQLALPEGQAGRPPAGRLRCAQRTGQRRRMAGRAEGRARSRPATRIAGDKGDRPPQPLPTRRVVSRLGDRRLVAICGGSARSLRSKACAGPIGRPHS